MEYESRQSEHTLETRDPILPTRFESPYQQTHPAIEPSLIVGIS